MNALQPVPFWVLVGESRVIKTRKSAAAGHLTASVNSNTKLPGLWLTQSRIKTLEPAGKMVAAQDKGPPRLSLSKVGMCQGKTKEKPKKKQREVTETEPTFCGDLEAETGDCDLMFLADEPADNRMRRKRGQIQIRGHFSPIHRDDTA